MRLGWNARARQRAGTVGATSFAAKSYVASLAYGLTAPSTRFVILTVGRTGSELLVELLDSHPQIACDSELLSVRRALPNRLVRGRAAVAGARSKRAHGFKLRREHVAIQELGDPAEYLAELHTRGTRIILLERRDMLQQALSFLRADETRYHERSGEAAEFSPSRVDPLKVVAVMYMIEDAVAFARRALHDIPHLRLIYEDHLALGERQQATADMICRYLGVPPAPVSTRLVKTAPSVTRERLENFDELAETLARTRYADFLGEAGIQPAAH